jgi:predicted DNA-binding transcriptional regulator AlpA
MQISTRHVAWREQDILDWIEDLPASQGSTWPGEKPEASTR